MEEIKFKIGDVVRCKPGFSTDYGDDYGGAGYISGLEFTINNISKGKSDAYFGKGTNANCGVYSRALEYATPKESLLISIL